MSDPKVRIEERYRLRIERVIEAYGGRLTIDSGKKDDAPTIVRHSGRLADIILWDLREDYRIIRRAKPQRST